MVDARNDDGTFADFLDLEIELLPEGTAHELVQVAPGLYAASLPTPPQGGYALHVIDHTRQRALTFPLTVPYPNEYRTLGQNTSALQRIADATGGRLLEKDVPLPDIAAAASTEYSPLHVALLLAALVIFLVDLIVRKWPSRRLRT